MFSLRESVLSILAAAISAPFCWALDIRPISRIQTLSDGAEILDYSAKDALLVATVSNRSRNRFGIEVFSLENPGSPQRIGFHPVPAALPGFESKLQALTSVAVDPAGRGFCSAAVVPRKSTTHSGALVFMDYRSGAILGVARTGYHPDSVAFSENGDYVFSADEGEFTRTGPQAPGSLTVVDLRGLRSAAQLRDPDYFASRTTVYSFAPPWLGPGCLPGVLRYNRRPEDPDDFAFEVEPEYVTSHQNEVFVTLQENNAVAVFDLAARRWDRFLPLGLHPVALDASDRDGSFGRRRLQIDDRVWGLPMPDAIAAFVSQGTLYFATANEGDPRLDDADLMRVKRAGSHGPRLDPGYRARLHDRYGSDPLLDANLGRLEVSTIDGDIDADGDVDCLAAFGTRSVSVWRVRDGTRVWDSGSLFEMFPRTNQPQAFNINRGVVQRYDSRSDNRGPEIEAVATGLVGTRRYLFAGAERQSAVAVFDVTHPERASFAAWLDPLPGGDFAPECLRFVPAQRQFGRQALLLASFEGSGSIVCYSVRP